MRGNSHLLTAAATGGVIADTLFFLLKSDSVSPTLHNIGCAIVDFIIPKENTGMPLWLFIFVGIFLYFIGSLLPDIDTPYSMLGRIIHLPFEHRTWTHAIWWPVALCIGGIWVRLLFWLGIGTFVHDFWDSMSASGLYWFYPAKPKENRHLKLYHTSKPSEFIVVGIVLSIAVLYTLVILQLVYHFVNITF